MKLHKIILVLTVSMMIIFGVLANASPQGLFPPKDPKQPFPPPKTTTTSSTTTTSTTTSTTPSTSTSPTTTPPSSAPTPTPTPTPSLSQSAKTPPKSSTEPSETGQQTGGALEPTPSSDSAQTPLTSKPKNNNHSNIKKTAFIGMIVVGFFSISALIFSVYRHIQKRRDYARDITSSIYSTDEMSKSDPIYPFSKRSNSFSNVSNNTTQPPRVPVTNHYETPIRNGGFGGPRPEYYNNYDNTHIRNRLQQTRGNVLVKPQPPPPPPPPQQPPQNYNWNYGVSVPTNQFLPMNQGGMFPAPYVRGNHGVPSSNNMNGNNNMSTLDYTSNNNYQVPNNDRQKNIQALKDSDKSSASNSNLDEHVYSEPEYSTTSFPATKTVQVELTKSLPEHIRGREDPYSSQSNDSEIRLNAPIFKK